ncbi:MAG TPA: hypothetical protein DCW47_09345 [Lachnospiraceae bacterium]|nr:hypothetical protein [Lachnospiraceae bacterium]
MFLHICYTVIMIRTVPYDDKFDRELELLDRDTFLELKYHGDVIKKYVTAAVCLKDHKERLTGVGYLLAPKGFRLTDNSNGLFFIHGIFRAFGEDEAEASILLLDSLREHFLAHVSDHPKKKLCLRLWCRTTDNAYMELLTDMGFIPCDMMYVMKKDLSGSKGMALTSIFKKASENGLKLVITRPDPCEEFLREYCIANEEAFRQPCSLDDLRFKLSFCEGSVYSAFLGERLVSCVTAWRVSDGLSATENIFCLPEKQNLGITRALLGYVLNILKKAGMTQAVLTVCKSEVPALRLYTSFGYKITHTLYEMRFGDDVSYLT